MEEIRKFQKSAECLPRLTIYRGKKQNVVEVGLGANVIYRLTKRLNGLGYHGYTNNYFTSVAGYVERSSNGVYMCGTIKANARGLPPEMKQNNICKDAGEFKTWQKGSTNLVAAVWRGKKTRKPVCMISTNLNPSAPPGVVLRRQKDGS